MRGCDVEAQHLDEARKTWRLAFGKLQHEPGQSRGVDDRVLERTLQASTHEPCVERVVAVLDEDRALCKAKKRSSRVAKLGSAYQHRTIDVVPLLGIGIDRRAAVDKGVEEREGARELESLSAKLEHQERGVPCRLDVDGDELGIVERRLRAKLRRVDRYLLPRDRLRRPSGLQVNLLHGRLPSKAERRNEISSRVIALRRTIAAA